VGSGVSRLRREFPFWRPNIVVYVPERAFNGVMRVTLHAG
jgi:hypothetical protein